MTTPSPIQRDVDLRALNTFGLPARAAGYARIASLAALRTALAEPAWQRAPRLVLGGGSNLVFTRDFDGLVLHIALAGTRIVGEDADAVLVEAAAGENWHGLIEWALAQGLGGLENLALIPGTVGASPIQNIGAYGLEMRERFAGLRALELASGEERRLGAEDCAFGYRDSAFKHALKDRCVITAVTFRLPKRWTPATRYAELAAELRTAGITAPTPRDVFDAICAIRRRKLPDPATVGNAGSFFKNPLVGAEQAAALRARFPELVAYPHGDAAFKLAAGWLIDRCGWKGRTLGRAGVYERQALVLVNRGGATGREVLALARAIQADVRGRFGVELEPEPLIL